MTASASQASKPEPEAWMVDPHEKTYHVMNNKRCLEKKHNAHHTIHCFI